MNYIYWLSQIQYSERSVVGNELFILSQLLQHECPILPGFVLGNNLWRQFLANLQPKLPVELDNLPARLELNNYQMLQSVASGSRQIIECALLSDTCQAQIFQAARQLNSAHLILQPFITTPYKEYGKINSLWRSHTCNATPKALATAIKLVWSELFTAHSLLYWHKLGLSIERIDLSISVRPLQTARASGTIELDRDLVRIRATWGLSLSLFQGDVEPDEYYLDRDTGCIVSQHLGHKNYAYRPKTASETPSVDCLETYIPPENLSSAYVLDVKAIAQLLQLTRDILAKQPQIRSLAWTAIEEGSTVNFYLTRFDDYPATTLSAEKIGDRASLSKQPLLTGIAASSGRVQAEVAVVEDLDTHTHAIPAGSILVTKTIAPQHLSALKHLGGIITEIGGKTSHGAILARELNIPAIVNVPNATQLIQDGTKVLLDGKDGKVYSPTVHQHLISLPPERISASANPIATKLMINISQPESIASAVDLPIDGVGLLRSELMLAEFLADRTLAQWQESFQRQFVATAVNYLRQFTTAFAPRPVFYRSLDLYTKDPSNPTSGSRGTQGYIGDPTLFDLELEALKIITAENHTNLNLILPFVRSVAEFEFCYRRIKNIGLTTQSSFQVWIMTEVPSTILLLPEYIRAGVRGIAIGTNDLTQLLLGVDRDRTQYSDRGLNANHPAMQKAIAKLIAIAKENDIECCICGRAPVEHPDLIDKLIEWGIDTISVEPEAVNRTYRAIARAERRILLEEVRGS